MLLANKQKNYKIMVYAIFTIGIFCMHIPMKYFNDDLTVLPSVETMSLFEFFVQRLYSNGKVLTDVFANFFYRFPIIVWKVFDTVVYLLIARIIAKTFTEDTWQDAVTVCLLIGLFPFWYLSTAGWVATSTNYLYPMLCLLAVASFVKRVSQGKRVRVFQCILAGCATVYATNQDQAAMILIGGLLLYLLYAVVVKADRKTIRCVSACLGFAVISYGVMFLLPGHINRMNSTTELNRWLPEYVEWSLPKKIYKGYTSTVANLFFHNVKLFDLFCLLVLLLSATNAKIANRIIGGVPFASVIGIHLLGGKNFVVYPSYAGGMPELAGVSSGWQGIAILLLTVFAVLCIFYTVFACTANRQNRWLLLLLLGLASGSRIMMGFSPTIYASHARTFTYFIYALILCNLIVFKEIKRKNHLWLVGVGAAVAMLLNVPSPFYWQYAVIGS